MGRSRTTALRLFDQYNYRLKHKAQVRGRRARGKLTKIQGDYDELESSHSQCPYWIQRNESLALASDHRCEKLEQENEKLQKLCDGLQAEIRRLRRLGHDDSIDVGGEDIDDM